MRARARAFTRYATGADRTSERMQRIFSPIATTRYRDFEYRGAMARGRALHLSASVYQ